MAEIILGRVLGQQGVKGDNGSTPYVGANGNWWIENSDTGVPANQAVSVQEKVKINGVSTNVNFIENKVVQDGLLTSNAVILDKATAFIKITEDMTQLVASHYIYTKIDDVNNKGFSLYVKPDGNYWIGYSRQGNNVWWGTLNKKCNKNDTLIVIDNGDSFKIYLNSLSDLIIEKTYISNNYTVLSTSPKNILNLYNRILTSQEIQHNFSVLNNSKSINKINDYAISTDTDHVQDRTGRVQDTINRVFYKQSCKEFTSNGDGITVNNGMDGYVLSGKLEGNTKLFKALKGTQEWVEILSTEARDTATYDYKLESAKGIVSNLGTKYSFYLNNEDKLNNKVIQLGGVGDVRGTFEIKEDGSGVLTQNTMEAMFDGSDDEKWSILDGYENTFSMSISATTGQSIVRAICNKFPYIFTESQYTNTSDRIWINHGGTGVRIRLGNYVDVTSFKTWLASNPVTVRYQLANPVVTTIDKSLVPTILTQLQNQFVFGDAVAPYKVTIQAPVNKAADFETRIAQLEKVITSTSNLSLYGNYAEDEYNKEINKL